MPEAALPFAPAGSLPAAVIVNAVDVVYAGRGWTELVGRVVSISQDVESMPVPDCRSHP